MLHVSSTNELTEIFKEKGLRDRGIDRLQITADFAVEYGFLLGKKTFQMNLNSKNLTLFTELCRKIQFISGNDNPILLKNPYDFSNFLFIKKIVPNAKFVFIHRHPFKILSSLKKAFLVLLKHRNYFTTQIIRTYNRIFENPLLLHTLRFFFSRIPLFGIVLLTYEDLCKNPQENIEKIMESLDIETYNKIDFTSFIKPRKTQLDSSVKQLREIIYKSMKEYFKFFGYQLEEHI